MSQSSIFTKVVRDENSCTQLLCNLMLRIPQFQIDMLGLLANGDRELTGTFTHREIKSQKGLHGCGTADLVIETDDLVLILEVKVRLHCEITKCQRDGKYGDFLRYQRKQNERRVVYLVPGDWVHIEEIRKQEGKRGGVETQIVCWERVCEEMDGFLSTKEDPLVREFASFLKDRFGPITFAPEEIDAMQDKNFAESFFAVRKLMMIADQLRVKKIDPWLEESDSFYPSFYGEDDPSEYSIYLKSKGDPENNLFWVGISPGTGTSLSFGFREEWKTASALLAAFPETSDSGFTRVLDDWWVFKVPERTFDDANPLERFWELLQPALKVVRQSSIGG